jgi:hypothetical protein
MSKTFGQLVSNGFKAKVREMERKTQESGEKDRDRHNKSASSKSQLP